MLDAFQIRLATRADLEIISQHRARMFKDMGELPAELFETFLAQCKDALHRLFERNQYIGWLASPKDQPEQIVGGAGVVLREVPPHPQGNADGEVAIAPVRQVVTVN